MLASATMGGGRCLCLLWAIVVARGSMVALLCTLRWRTMCLDASRVPQCSSPFTAPCCIITGTRRLEARPVGEAGASATATALDSLLTVLLRRPPYMPAVYADLRILLECLALKPPTLGVLTKSSYKTSLDSRQFFPESVFGGPRGAVFPSAFFGPTPVNGGHAPFLLQLRNDL